MSRNEKIGAVALGVLLFAGLFYFIYTTMKNPLPTGDFGGDEAFGDNLNEDGDAENFAGDEDLDGEIPEISTATATAPAAATPAKALPEPNKK